ncbi:heparinase II/III family protein [Vallitalea pronyensis]|uniref:Heparinase II/III family protein n=1 Tax=Vallitalea pronyensis TaxID=1348613 RepID=A0A8J8MMU8_9FIRM|nr:heparinase II/III family protein [Vallitalea pronyensis]QUI24665.1 heparinase II/III family protein [Vallitalea pronyensis]
MEYFELNKLQSVLTHHEDYQRMIETMEKEVHAFGTNFHDDPSIISRWGHHYFCSKDGGLLIYNRETPTSHQCEICGHVYDNSPLLNGVWVYMYRNEAILNAWKAAFLYRLMNKDIYLDYVKNIIGFYVKHYQAFKLHNKEGAEYDHIEEMSWGCGRIMPQGLNESIFIIRMINALELVKDDIGDGFLENVYYDLFQPCFKLLQPQVDKIHNISCWLNSAIGMMGLFSQDDDMIDFAFCGTFNIRRQIREGVTADGFWYEGSIHYNFFTLEGITNLLLFSSVYDFDFGHEKHIIKRMFLSAYMYSFDNHQLPNPNDGWPNINLKSYSYIYCMAVKVFGEQSKVGNLLKNVLHANHKRGTFPLSKPYYYHNAISLERLLHVPGLVPSGAMPIHHEATNFITSHCAILKHKTINIFCKYGHNGPSHAHPDKMNIEVVIGEDCLSRDLSNSGYGNALCNEWHRMSVSHNTVVVDGKNHVSMEAGECLAFQSNSIDTRVRDVYPGVDYRRKLELFDNGYTDEFQVDSEKEHTYDFFFHVEGELMSKHTTEPASLGYKDNGYQHIRDVQRVIADESMIHLDWKIGSQILTSSIQLNQQALFVGRSPDNPVTSSRTTIIIRAKAKQARYQLKWTLKKEV